MKQQKQGIFVFFAAFLFLVAGVVRPVSADTAPVSDQDETERLLANFDAEWAAEPAGFPDPLEPWNRSVFRFNRTFENWVFDPVTDVYVRVLPEPGRHAVHRFFDNLNTPATFANDLFQGKLKKAAVTTCRFIVNTTAGIGGLFDPAKAIGLKRHENDFGRTMAMAGVPSGPYLIVPVLGPTTVRDGIGTVVDMFFRPTTYFLAGMDQIYYAGIYGASAGVVEWQAHVDDLHMLESSSVDYYAALRSAYYQARTAETEGTPSQPSFAASQGTHPGTAG